jgi:uncharacterized protein YegL
MEGMPKIGPIAQPRTFHQLGIFVLDGSGSMEEEAQGATTKAQAVNIAMRELLTRFKVSKQRKNFSFAVITFDTDANIHTPVTPADIIDDNASFDPLQGHGGGTHIHEGLSIAEKIANDFINQAPTGGVPHSAIILLMSDGLCQQVQETKQTAKQIKQGANSSKITICTTYFAQKGTTNVDAKALLQEIATDPVLGFKEVYEAETLRAFFISSITTAATNIQINTVSSSPVFRL